MVDLSVRIGDITMQNPVTPASGAFSWEYNDVIDLNRLGGLVAKTICREPRLGNAELITESGPRDLERTPEGIHGEGGGNIAQRDVRGGEHHAESLGGEHHRVVEREDVAERAEADPFRPLGSDGEERERVGRDRELREEVVLDDGVGVVPEPVSVLDLLQHLGVDARHQRQHLLERAEAGLRVGAVPGRQGRHGDQGHRDHRPPLSGRTSAIGSRSLRSWASSPYAPHAK